MNAEICLQKLKKVGVLSFATVDENGKPQIRCISAIHYDNDGMYFFTARGKNFCRELLNNPQVQILAYTKFKEMIRLSAKAYPASEQQNKIDKIFAEQPYLKNVYPGDTNKIGIIFEIKDAQIEYFNLGVKPIFRETYTLGSAAAETKGYTITNKCISCQKCVSVCPQGAIDKGMPNTIRQENCLHCGACYEICPVKAVERV